MQGKIRPLRHRMPWRGMSLVCKDDAPDPGQDITELQESLQDYQANIRMVFMTPPPGTCFNFHSGRGGGRPTTWHFHVLSCSFSNNFSVHCGLGMFRQGGGGTPPPWTPSPPPPPAQASPCPPPPLPPPPPDPLPSNPLPLPTGHMPGHAAHHQAAPLGGGDHGRWTPDLQMTQRPWPSTWGCP